MTLRTRLGKGRSRYLLQEEIMIVPRQTPSNGHIWFMNGHVTHFWPMRNKDKPAKRLWERNFPQVKRQPANSSLSSVFGCCQDIVSEAVASKGSWLIQTVNASHGTWGKFSNFSVHKNHLGAFRNTTEFWDAKRHNLSKSWVGPTGLI